MGVTYASGSFNWFTFLYKQYINWWHSSVIASIVGYWDWSRQKCRWIKIKYTLSLLNDAGHSSLESQSVHNYINTIYYFLQRIGIFIHVFMAVSYKLFPSSLYAQTHFFSNKTNKECFFASCLPASSSLLSFKIDLVGWFYTMVGRTTTICLLVA